jgi:hypothetical protein
MYNIFKYNQWLKESNEKDTILKDPNTSYDEKEDKMVKLRLEQVKKYKSDKNKLESIILNLDKEIDVTTINKIVNDNPFTENYIFLITKKRRQQLLENNIEKTLELLETLKKELNISEESDDRNKIQDEIKENEEELKNNKSELLELKDIDNLLSKWDRKVDEMHRTLSKGESILIDFLKK